jgi:hypothetical protein
MGKPLVPVRDSTALISSGEIELAFCGYLIKFWALHQYKYYRNRVTSHSGFFRHATVERLQLTAKAPMGLEVTRRLIIPVFADFRNRLLIGATSPSAPHSDRK